MDTLSRRSFLAGAAAAAAPVLAAGLPGAAVARERKVRRRRVRVTHDTHRVVVVGSGFGGGVSALRLAQAGVSVLVLERGLWWKTGPNANTFPSLGHPDKRALWYGSAPVLLGTRVSLDPYAGLLESVEGENMLALCAAGVGGGSLVYQGMTLEPDEAVFNAYLPEQLDWPRMNRVHYPRVAQMLQIATAPDELINSPNYLAARVFARDAQSAGFSVSKIPMPIDWSYALAELRGEMKPSYTNGDCALGVNNGGKHSVDVTYIAAAMRTGRATVAPLHNVTDVERGKNGNWLVHVDRTDATGAVLEKKVISTKALIMSTGSLGTSRMLVRAAAKGLIPNMPDALGQGYGTNGDRIYIWTDVQEDFGPNEGGPVIYGSKEWEGNPHMANTIIQASIPPTGLDLHSTILVGFGVSSARGKFVYDSAADEAKLVWPADGDHIIHQRIHDRIAAVAGPLGVLTDTNALMPSTWHSLGGACMGTVCDLEGRVHDQPGLYVIDGALIPGTTCACNPSMTIAAVAERALDDIVKHDIGKIF